MSNALFQMKQLPLMTEIHVGLTILTEKSCVLLNSVREFIELEAWLLLTFFICLYNQLSSIHSIVKY